MVAKGVEGEEVEFTPVLCGREAASGPEVAAGEVECQGSGEPGGASTNTVSSSAAAGGVEEAMRKAKMLLDDVWARYPDLPKFSRAGFGVLAQYEQEASGPEVATGEVESQGSGEFGGGVGAEVAAAAAAAELGGVDAEILAAHLSGSGAHVWHRFATQKVRRSPGVKRRHATQWTA